jgi:hypothetical protein
MKNKIPQELWSQLRATGHVPAQPWVIEKVPVRLGRKRVDARQPSVLDIWPDARVEISDKVFQTFWIDASAKHSYSTDWNKSSVKGIVAIRLAGGVQLITISILTLTVQHRLRGRRSSLLWLLRCVGIAVRSQLLLESLVSYSL